MLHVQIVICKYYLLLYKYYYLLSLFKKYEVKNKVAYLILATNKKQKECTGIYTHL